MALKRAAASSSTSLYGMCIHLKGRGKEVFKSLRGLPGTLIVAGLMTAADIQKSIAELSNKSQEGRHPLRSRGDSSSVTAGRRCERLFLLLRRKLSRWSKRAP